MGSETANGDGRRPDGRISADAMRRISLKKNPAPAAAGSVLIKVGKTEILCAASVEESVPRWMRQQKITGGWVTAEYRMLPYATSPRKPRASSLGKLDGRTQEIQRLVGRSLRSVIDLDALGPRTVWVDCDVIRADGGTRTASVTGGWLALALAVRRLQRDGALAESPIREAVAGVSVGLVDGAPRLDLCYEEDLAASTDMNVVMTESGRFVELQGTAESAPFTASQLDAMRALAAGGIRELLDRGRALLG
jgi:ribonuclease PH